MKLKLSHLLPFPAVLAGLSGCTIVEPRDHPGYDRSPYYESRPLYSQYEYDFYPRVAVYFHLSTGYYFYEEHGRWIRVRQLPPHIHLDIRHRKHLSIRDPFPYIRYSEHARLYGGRDEDRDRDDSRRHERDTKPLRPDADRHDREERRSSAPDDRSQTRKEQVIPGHAQDDERPPHRMHGGDKEGDKPQAPGRERATDERPEARTPPQGALAAPHARGRDGRDDANNANAPAKLEAGKPEEKIDRNGRGDNGEQGEKDRKARSPSLKSDDDETRGRTHGAPWSR